MISMKLTNLFSRKKPVATPRKFSIDDWKEAFFATKEAISSKRIGILAAGIAYFMTLAFFPLVAASIAIAGYMVQPGHIQGVATAIEHYLPTDIAGLINGQLKAALENKAANTIVAVISIAL